MTLDRRHFFATGAGLGLAGAGMAAAEFAAHGQTLQAGARGELLHGPSVSGLAVNLEASGDLHERTSRLQEALDLGVRTGVPVLLPPGSYLTGPLRFEGSVQVIGAAGTTRLTAVEPGPLLSGHGGSRIQIEGLALDGGGVADRLISLQGCGGIIRDCTLVNAADAGLFSIDGAGLTVAFNTVEHCANNGIQVWRSSPGEDASQILSNRISSIEARGGGSGQNGNGVNVYRAGGVTVSGNRIEACAYSAIRGNAASNLQVLANQCRALGEVAIYAEFGFEGAVISQNIVDGAATGIAVTNFNEGGRLGIIQGNLVRNLKRRPLEPVDKRGEGITVEADSVVGGNLIENAEATGLSIGWGPFMRNVIANGNIVRGANIGIGITADAKGGSCIVTDNLLADCRRGAILGMDHGKVVGAELGHSDTKTERVRISGNLVTASGG